MKKYIIFFLILHFSVLTAQTALKSTEEEYFDFLSLQGLVERPTLGYRTLSDSVWKIPEGTEHVWQNNNLGTVRILFESENQGNNRFTKGFFHGIKLKIYGPEWYNSFNTAAPYGQNDGALWQGRGYNTSLTGGARLEGYGFEITLKPMLTFSQNLEFEFIKPNYDNIDSNGNPTLYFNKAGLYGYYGVPSIDAPQRFGDKPIFIFDWNDTDIRYTINNFTIGFGFQTPWLGPAIINPIIHSNNAASYPKLDFGLRKTKLYIPKTDIYLGDLEFRIWWGMLSESDFFDNNEENNNNLISGFTFSWKVPFTNLSLNLNRTMLSKFNNLSTYKLFHILLPFDTSCGTDESDQRFSISADWLFEQVGLELFFEWGRNDFSPSLDYIIRYPFHTQGWSAGIKKTSNLSNSLKGIFYLEFTNLECSMDYDRLISWYSTFYAHHIITQGYTNKGQWLGASMTGGNSQTVGYTLYNKKWKLDFSFQRRNPDLDFTKYIDKRLDQTNAESNIRVQLITSVDFCYFIFSDFYVNTGIALMDDRNYLNVSKNGYSSTHRINVNINALISYKF